MEVTRALAGARTREARTYDRLRVHVDRRVELALLEALVAAQLELLGALGRHAALLLFHSSVFRRKRNPASSAITLTGSLSKCAFWSAAKTKLFPAVTTSDASMPWSACNPVLEQRWRGAQLQAHRGRLDSIASAASTSTRALSVALAGGSSPERVHPTRRRGSAGAKAAAAVPPALMGRSKSPAAKSRQRQIERDNLALINKILAQEARGRKPHGARPRPASVHCVRPTREEDEDVIDVRSAMGIAAHDHECAPMPDAPRSAASHALYKRRSAGAHVGFCDQNAPRMDREAGAARRRSQAQRKILEENKKLLERIMTARTSVSRAVWQRHEQEHNKLLNNISRHRVPRQEEHHYPNDHLARSSSMIGSGLENVVAIGGDAQASPTRDRRRSRPLSASNSAPMLPMHSARASDSVVARMRRMVIEQAEGASAAEHQDQ